MDRRNFIEKSALAAGAITVIPSCVLAGGKNRFQPSDTINLAYIGVGKQSLGLLRSLNKCPETLVLKVSAAIARGLNNAEFAYRAAAHLQTLSGHRFVAVDRVLSGLAGRLSVQCRLRGCDAVYAALAHREGARLITWDQQQQEGAAIVMETLTPIEALAVLR